MVPTSADNVNEYHLPARLHRILLSAPHLVLSHEGHVVTLKTTQATIPVTVVL